MAGVPEKAIFRSMTVNNNKKNISTQCNLPAQIEQVQDEIWYDFTMIAVKYLTGLKTIH